MTELSTSQRISSWPHGFSVETPEPALLMDAIAADEAAPTEVDLALTWRELVQGLVSVVGGFFDGNRCGLVLSTVGSKPTLEGPLRGRILGTLEAVLCGAGQKAIAIEFDLAPSTVALNLRVALERMGVSGRPSRVHPLLMLAASAAGRRALVPATVGHFRRGEVDLQVIAVPRPDLALNGQMPAAELDVVRALVEGRSYAEIAGLRGTSERTVANQLAGAFRRLQVSGRSQLIQRLFVLSGWLRSVQ
jgi:DNA-binding NarL/FixJ family response regulator